MRRLRAAGWLLVVAVCVLPGRLVEEGLHAGAGLLVGARIHVEIDPWEDTAVTHVQFREETHGLLRLFVRLVPELAAAVFLAAVIVHWVVVGPVWWPATTADWLLLAISSAQFAAILNPAGELEGSSDA